MAREFLKELDLLIRSRKPMIYLVTWEEDRALEIIRDMAHRSQKHCYEWSITSGLRRVDRRIEHEPLRAAGTPIAVLNEVLQSEADAIYVLKDFHHYIEGSEIARQLRDLDQALRATRKTVIFVSPKVVLPLDLEKSISIVDLPLPEYEELHTILLGIIKKKHHGYWSELSSHEAEMMAKAALGLTRREAHDAFKMAVVEDGKLSREDIARVLEEKRQILRKTEVLEYCPLEGSLADVGGMDLLKKWLDRRVQAFEEQARVYGLPQPRGILLMGVQGCGKSLIAKTVAASWKLPLLRLDMSRIFREYIGSSEQNMRRALAVAESIAPTVLWIDEIEKAFSGSSDSSHVDGGTTARILAQVLTWMQEKTAPVFVVATANQVEKLPPELLRKGRLDEVFFVDLPTPNELVEIFAIQLRKRKRDPKLFDLRTLASAALGFSGAEVEQAVVSALHDSYFERREVTTEDILRNIRQSVPLSTTMREKIELLRSWATDRARVVSSEQAIAPVELSRTAGR